LSGRPSGPVGKGKIIDLNFTEAFTRAQTSRGVNTLEERGRKVTISGEKSSAATDGAEATIVAFPIYCLKNTTGSVVDELEGCLLVSRAVGVQRDEDRLHDNPPGTGSVTALAANKACETVPVVGATHNLATGRLVSPDRELDWDVPVVADDNKTKETITELMAETERLRPLDAAGK
jgi:predicted dinucleotide-binding enzyme